MLDPDYYSNITEDTDNQWIKTHGGKNVSETIKKYLVEYVGKPLKQLLRYRITQKCSLMIYINVQYVMSKRPGHWENCIIMVCLSGAPK